MVSNTNAKQKSAVKVETVDVDALHERVFYLEEMRARSRRDLRAVLVVLKDAHQLRLDAPGAGSEPLSLAMEALDAELAQVSMLYVELSKAVDAAANDLPDENPDRSAS